MQNELRRALTASSARVISIYQKKIYVWYCSADQYPHLPGLVHVTISPPFHGRTLRALGTQNSGFADSDHVLPVMRRWVFERIEYF